MFRGEIARGPYARAALIRIGSFVAATAAYPFLLMLFLDASGCRSVGGACGALGLVASLYVKPAIYFSFVLSFVPVTARRLRDLKLPVALTAALPLLMTADATFGVAFGAPWSVSFVLGAGYQWPRYLFTALVCIAFLCIVPRPADGDVPRWGMSAAIALGIVAISTLNATVAIIRSAALWMDPMNGVKFSIGVAQYYGLYGIPALFVLVASLAAWRQTRRLPRTP